MSFNDKVEENNLDLSLNGLIVVPVTELAATPKAISVDLSCNLLQILPNHFASLTHLVKIDLSRNKLTELPENFGNLINLQHLDLDKNFLKTLPISFCRLKNLRWLDLKDNPLEPKLQAVAGNCLDGNQCLLCAKRVVNYMQSIDSNLERDKQKKLKEKREKEAVEKAKMEKELEEQRRLKKAEKERRKAESKARREEKLKNQSSQNVERDSSHSETDSREETGRLIVEKKGINWCKWFIVLLFLAIGVVIYTVASAPNSHLKYFSKKDVQIFAKLVIAEITRTASNAWKFISPYAFQVKVIIMSHIHGIMLSLSQLATDVELLLSDYF